MCGFQHLRGEKPFTSENATADDLIVSPTSELRDWSAASSEEHWHEIRQAAARHRRLQLSGMAAQLHELQRAEEAHRFSRRR